MSIESSAVLLYGFVIDEPDAEDRDEYLSRVLTEAGLAQQGVGYAPVGLWDQWDLYLCTEYHEADRTDPKYRMLELHDAEAHARWDGLLHAAARALGVKHHDPGQWILLVHES